MAFYKGFPGNYHPEPWGAQNRATMERIGWRVLREDPLTWIAKDGSLMRVVPAPQAEDTIPMAQWFIAGIMSSELQDPARVAAWDALTAGDWRYIVDLYAADSDVSPDGLGPFESFAQAIACAEDEVRRVADLAEDERDPTMDWAVSYRIRPTDWSDLKLKEPIAIVGFDSAGAFTEALGAWEARQAGKSNPFLDEVAEALDETELNSIDPAIEVEMRVVMGYRLAAILIDWLEECPPENLAACREGRADPCDFFDDNDATFSAYCETFDPDWDLNKPEVANRANAATRVAAVLLRRDDLCVNQLRAIAAHNDPVGLSHTITRKEG